MIFGRSGGQNGKRGRGRESGAATAGEDFRHALLGMEGSMSDFSGKFAKVLTAIMVVLMLASIAAAVPLTIFLIDWFSSWFPEVDWISRGNVIMWLVGAGVILAAFGTLRVITSYVFRVFGFVFRIAQNDVITVVVGLVANGLMLVLAGWITFHLVGAIGSTGVSEFYSHDNWFSFVPFFLLTAASVIWIPRVGVYGEAKLGQFDGVNQPL